MTIFLIDVRKKIKKLFLSESNFTRVVLPAPEGDDKTIIIPPMFFNINLSNCFYFQ